MPTKGVRSEARIRKRSHFDLVCQKGNSASGVYVRVWFYEAGLGDGSGGPKLGLMVSKKTDRRAVGRNRWKRRIREVFRRNRARFKASAMVVIKSKSGNEAPAYGPLEAEILQLLSRTGAVK